MNYTVRCLPCRDQPIKDSRAACINLRDRRAYYLFYLFDLGFISGAAWMERGELAKLSLEKVLNIEDLVGLPFVCSSFS